MTAKSVFADYKYRIYAHRWRATIQVDTLVGGIPKDPNKAKGWLQSKLGASKEERIQKLAAETMVEMGVTLDEAMKVVADLEGLNGFKVFDARTVHEDPAAVVGGLYAEGRCLKSMVKEASNIQWPKRKWGPTNKGTRGFWSEHVFVEEDRIPILDEAGANITAPTDINQRFVHTWRGSGIQYEEYVEDAIVSFTVISDFPFKHDDLATLWVTAEANGFGASRSQGFGKFAVIAWDSLGSGKGKIREVEEPEEGDEELAATTTALAEEAGVSPEPVPEPAGGPIRVKSQPG